MKNLLILTLTLILTACGTANTLSKADIDRPIQKGLSRVIVKRDTSLLYFAAAAEVSANGEKVASLAPGGEAVRDVKAGTVSLEVSTFGSFGRYVTRFEAKPGKSYRCEISPRGSALMSSTTGAFFLGTAGAMAGDARAASASEQSGYFQISLKEDGQ